MAPAAARPRLAPLEGERVLTMNTAIFNAIAIYAIAGTISMLVALLIKGLFVIVRRLSKEDGRD